MQENQNSEVTKKLEVNLRCIENLTKFHKQKKKKNCEVTKHPILHQINKENLTM